MAQELLLGSVLYARGLVVFFKWCFNDTAKCFLWRMASEI